MSVIITRGVASGLIRIMDGEGYGFSPEEDTVVMPWWECGENVTTYCRS